MDITKIQALQQQLAPYHGSLLLSHITNLEQKDLLDVFGSTYENLTVTKARQRLLDNLSAESVALQFKNFQKALEDGIITRGAGRLDENKRKELFKDYERYELLQIAFSPAIHYFQINPKTFKKGDTTYNNQVYKDAIDMMIIDPSKVPQSSLDALGIKQLDPDCQNLKDVFKKMVSLKYSKGAETVYTPTINMYDGKFITFSSQSVIFPVEGKTTQGEKRKEDIRTQMAVYLDLFSMLRREDHILESNEGKTDEYKNIKKELISQIQQIDWKQKTYGASVRVQVQEIINEIAAATNAKIVAQKIYKLYKVHGNNSVHDKKLLESAITGFTKRIAQLIGISAHVQLHSLELDEKLDMQTFMIESFHAGVKSNVDTGLITLGQSGNFFYTFTNYDRVITEYIQHYKSLQEPFLSFWKQIEKLLPIKTIKELENKAKMKNLQPDEKNTVLKFMVQADILVSLQRRFLSAFTLEHGYKNGDLSTQEVWQKIQEMLDDGIDENFDMIYRNYFNAIDTKRNQFSCEFTYDEMTAFFHELKNLNELNELFSALKAYLSTNEPW